MTMPLQPLPVVPWFSSRKPPAPGTHVCHTDPSLSAKTMPLETEAALLSVYLSRAGEINISYYYITETATEDNRSHRPVS